MKILVTGGAGFIGSHLCEDLLLKGHEIAVTDDLNDFYDPKLKLANLDALNAKGRVRFDHGDIADEAFVNRIFLEFRPELVVHLAARAGVRPSLKDPLLYERTNVRGTVVLLEASRRSAVRRFVFASSSSIYGISNTVPFREDDFRNYPVSPYAATKLAGEKICFTYSHLYRLPCVCLRFFTVYGPRQRPDLAIRRFVERIDAGLPITMFGDGSSARDYTYVDDTVRGVVASLEYESDYDVINLGNSRPISLLDMIRAIEAAVGKPATIEHLPDQPGDVPITYADISKAKMLLGYSPSTPFEDGIQKVVSWVRQGVATADPSIR
jgi:UDP-glucuronate 4-epimerase